MSKQEWADKKTDDARSSSDIEITDKDEPSKKNRMHEINTWLKQHQKLVYITLCIILTLSIILLFFALRKDYSVLPLQNHKLKVTKIPVSPLTGLPIKDPKLAKRPVTAVMIENSPDARPQSGLGAAGVVFEAVAEGGITRFEAFYQESQPKLIGPVRSLRPYYFDWAKTFNASVAHVGGSTEALNKIRSPGERDLDQFFNADTYWRASDRWAPHNVYTSSDKLSALNKSKGFKNSNFTSLKRQKPSRVKPAEKLNATSIKVDISSDTFNPSFRYNKKSNSYIRYQDGAPHIDRETKKPIEPKVVIALLTSVTPASNGYYMVIKTTGKGTAYIFQNGTVTKSTWTKADNKSQYQFTAADGKPILLNPGLTWFSVTANDKEVTWK